jgi:hypothetical protein
VGIVENSQDVRRSAQERLTSQTSLHNGLLLQKISRVERYLAQAERERDAAREEAAEAAEDAKSEISWLKERLAKAEAEVAHRDILLEARRQQVVERNEIIDAWVVEQTAFKNLLRKFGKLPDGTAIVDLPQEERQRIVDTERADVLAKRNQDKPST